jgi:predicted Zn finger-like uncharacterized protein
MKTACEHCYARYEIPDARIAGRVLSIRCKRCQGAFTVVGPTTAALDDEARPPTLTRMRPLAPAPTPSMAPMRTPARWWIAISGKRYGPFREHDVKALVNRGDVHGRTYVWTLGMPGWERVAESPTLAWIYEWVIERAGAHVVATADARMESPFDMAGLVTDGNAYFADPTLKSGWIVLDERTQAYLETCRRRAEASRPRPLVAAWTMAILAITLLATGGAFLTLGT